MIIIENSAGCLRIVAESIRVLRNCWTFHKDPLGFFRIFKNPWRIHKNLSTLCRIIQGFWRIYKNPPGFLRILKKNLCGSFHRIRSLSGAGVCLGARLVYLWIQILNEGRGGTICTIALRDGGQDRPKRPGVNCTGDNGLFWPTECSEHIGDICGIGGRLSSQGAVQLPSRVQQQPTTDCLCVLQSTKVQLHYHILRCMQLCSPTALLVSCRMLPT
jgi:hypothetical protein